MRKLLLAMTTSLFLASCATTGTGTFDPAQLQRLVDQIKVYTAAACNVIPEAAGVVALISAFYPEAAIAGNAIAVIGTAICTAPTAMSIRKGAQQYRIVRIVIAPNGKKVQVRVQPVR